MKYIIVAVLVLLASCDRRVNAAQWDYAEQLCADNYGVFYVEGTYPTNTLQVTTRCENGAEFDIYLNDTK